MTLNPLKLSLFQRVIASLLSGIIAGIFFGEPMGHLEIVGNIYIKLLQMTVIPYILVSLIGGLGRLDMKMAKVVGIKGGGLILFLWTLTILSLLFLPLAYPKWTSASFFSSNIVADENPIRLLDLYIPANPFYAMANTIVPAIVVFSIFLGVAMITVNNKDGFILSMQNLADALMKMASVVAKTAPIGIFALSAAAAGTLHIHELSRLQIYLWVYIGAWVILAFFTLPMLVARATPFSYREVIKEARLAMVTAFATGTVLVVLLMIAEKVKELLAGKKMDSGDAISAVDVLVPTAYSFPSVGTLLGIGFILFAAWFNGASLSITDYPAFCVLGVLTAFGSMAVAIPFLLDYFKLPADMFQLYLLGSVFTMRFATTLAAMHGIVICILGASAIMNRLSWRRMVSIMATSLAITGAAMTGLGFVLTKAIPYEYTGYKELINMKLMGPMAEVIKAPPPAPLTPEERRLSRLGLVQSRGILRVGYAKDRLPFAFKNKDGEVVGYDLELMHALALDLKVKLQIVKVEWEKVAHELDQGRIDIAVGGISISPQRALKMVFSDTYREESLGLIVPDHMRNKFSSYKKLLAMKGLRLGATRFRFQEGAGQQLFPNAEIVEIKSLRSFFKGKEKGLDGLIFTAESAAAWTLVYPQWTVVVPKGLHYKSPMAFALPHRQEAWRNFINVWLKHKLDAGLGERAYGHWILGNDSGKQGRRWSVVKDMLGWGRQP